MNKKIHPLTQADVDNFHCPRIIADTVQRCVSTTETEPGSIRVLDFGCGRGTLVATLRAQGVTAYGVDVSPEYIHNGRQYFETVGIVDENLLTVLDGSGKSVFPDKFFDVIVSDQVCEHVPDMEVFVSENRRLLKPGGVALHILPARWRVVEVHVHVPFAHWMPTPRLRRAVIQSWLWVKGGARESGPLADQVEILDTYLARNTFYRRKNVLLQYFRAQGLATDWHTATLRQVDLRFPLIARILRRLRPIDRLFTSACSSFRMLVFYAYAEERQPFGRDRD